jgi:hypothetical protein
VLTDLHERNYRLRREQLKQEHLGPVHFRQKQLGTTVLHRDHS